VITYAERLNLPVWTEEAGRQLSLTELKTWIELAISSTMRETVAISLKWDRVTIALRPKGSITFEVIGLTTASNGLPTITQMSRWVKDVIEKGSSIEPTKPVVFIDSEFNFNF
jgi:hypothetical protein